MGIPSNYIFVLRPPSISFVSNIYYLPFTGLVWVCSIALVILSTIVIALTLTARSVPEERNKHLTIPDYFMFSIAAVCQMGPEIFSTFYSARIATVGIRNRNFSSIDDSQVTIFNHFNEYFSFHLFTKNTSFSSSCICFLYLLHLRRISWHCYKLRPMQFEQ